MDREHRPTLRSLLHRVRRCRCGAVSPCPVAAETAERDAAVQRILQYSRDAFTPPELRGNTGRHWE